MSAGVEYSVIVVIEDSLVGAVGACLGNPLDGEDGGDSLGSCSGYEVRRPEAGAHAAAPSWMSATSTPPATARVRQSPFLNADLEWPLTVGTIRRRF